MCSSFVVRYLSSKKSFLLQGHNINQAVGHVIPDIVLCGLSMAFFSLGSVVLISCCIVHDCIMTANPLNDSCLYGLLAGGYITVIVDRI